jgi:hypothetical protein
VEIVGFCDKISDSSASCYLGCCPGSSMLPAILSLFRVAPELMQLNWMLKVVASDVHLFTQRMITLGGVQNSLMQLVLYEMIGAQE